MQTVVVVDYGVSNLRSVARALEFVADGKANVVVSDDVDIIGRADRIVFPGQGAIGDCMRHLNEKGLTDIVRNAATSKPFLGICLGLQSLLDYSEEDGGTKALGLYRGKVSRFADKLSDPSSGERLKVPHMGWNTVTERSKHPLWEGIDPQARFYFVHSYFVEPSDPQVISGRTGYGIQFVSALATGNVFATQFHPEKSQRPGLKLLENFLSWPGSSG